MHIIYQGRYSQTGVATSKRFDEIEIPEKDERSFEEIREDLSAHDNKAVLPIWNYHVGEIEPSHVFEMIFEMNMRVYSLWPSRIIFLCLSGNADDEVAGKDVLSIGVAETQCSDYIHSNQLRFVKDIGSTTQAYEMFSDNPQDKLVLCSPDMNKDEFNIVSSDASNPLNFTVFGVLAPGSSKDRGFNWDPFKVEDFNGGRVYSSLEFSARDFLSEEQQGLFSEIFNYSENDDIPKIIFIGVDDHSSKYRIILESKYGLDDASLDEINLVGDIGSSVNEYFDEVVSALPSDVFLDEDRIYKHVGTKTCFFACPALGIVTHGYEETLAENMFRLYLGERIDRIDGRDLSASTSEEIRFYDRYISSYKDLGVEAFDIQDLEYPHAA